MSKEQLFTLRVGLTNKERGNKVLRIIAWNYDAREGEYGHTRIDCEAFLYSDENGYGDTPTRKKEQIFSVGDVWCGIPSHQSIDGNAAKECVLSLVGMKPGDTDADYFKFYTPRQLEFAEEFGETIALEAEVRYGTR